MIKPDRDDQSASEDQLRPIDLISAGSRAGEAGDWDEAARLFGEASDITKRPNHAARQVRALLNAKRPLDALDICNVAPGLNDPAAHELRMELKIGAELAAGLNSAAVQSLAQTRPGALPPQVLNRLINACHASGTPLPGKVILPHIGVLDAVITRALYEARQSEAAGDLVTARLSYKEIERQSFDPTWAAFGTLQLARLSTRLGEYVDAKRYWSKVLQQEPAHKEALHFLFEQAVRVGATQKAKKYLSNLRNQISEDDAALLEARVYEEAEEPERATIVLDEAIARGSSDTRLHLALARLLVRRGQLSLAGDALRTCLSFAGHDAKVNLAYYDWLVQTGAPSAERLDQAQRSLALDPDCIRIVRGIGRLLYQAGRHADALRHYLSVVESSSAPADIWSRAAELLVAESRAEDALELAERANRQFGEASAENCVYAAEVYLAARAPRRSRELIEKAKSLQPDLLAAVLLGARLELAEGRDLEAWRQLAVAVSDLPAKPSAAWADISARTASAIRIPLRAGSKEADHNLFPERLFHHVARNFGPDRCHARHGVVHVSAHLGAGGAERQLSYALGALTRRSKDAWPQSVVIRSLDANRGHDFYLKDVVSSSVRPTELTRLSRERSIRRVLERRPELREIVGVIAAAPPELSEVALPLLAYFIETKPKIAHLWQDSICAAGSLAAMVAGVPALVLSFRSTTPVEVQRSRRYLRQAYLDIQTYGGDVTLLNNSKAGARDYEQWLELPDNTVKVIYNGYDFDRIGKRATECSPAEIRRTIGIPADAVVVGSVFRFAGEKRPELWIDTLAQLIQRDENVYGLLVGEGPRWQRLVEDVESRGLGSRLKLVGRKNPVEPWIAAMDLFFLASRREGLPNVLIEAQSLKVPVVATNVGGANETVAKDGASILLPEADAEELSGIILAALIDKDWRKSAGARAKSHVENCFGLDAVCSHLTGLYEGIDSRLGNLTSK